MRVKRGVTAHKKHKKLLKATKGYTGSYSRLVKRAHEALLHAGEYSKQSRRKRTGDFRSLWIGRINAGLTEYGVRYSDFINLLNKSNIKLNRKVMADLALDHPKSFRELVALVKK